MYHLQSHTEFMICAALLYLFILRTLLKGTHWLTLYQGSIQIKHLITRYTGQLLPCSDEAEPPSATVGSKAVPLTLNTLTASLDLTVAIAFPVMNEIKCNGRYIQ